MEDTQVSDADSGDRTVRADFPIVGVGASAGGLAATSDLLQHLGSAPGVAIVIVHHLDPTHPSSLVEIFARNTSLPVHTAQDGLVVEPNHVYVVPPGAELAIERGCLRITPRSTAGGLHLPIDRFFESLALNSTVSAMGVVLSGSGSDGSRGIKAIKAGGGISFAQDASAEYRSMPDAAIATGCVDFVLPPEGIAREVVRIAADAPPVAAAADDASEEADLQRVLRALRRAAGIDLAGYKLTTIRRRVQRRLLIRGLKSLGAYAALLEGDPEEARALCEDVLIHVTSFFRDPDTFEVLKSVIVPKLLEQRPGDSALRVWVPGCSTGEEVYSIAMCLLEALADADKGHIPVKLFGTDVSLSAIDKARAGRYPASIERDVSQGRLQRFFSHENGVYQIRRVVRDCCIFARHDVTQDPPFSGMDLVSCRNLMIYLGPALQERIVPILHYALKEPGFLMLGSAESIRAFPGFSVLDSKNKIYARSSGAPRMPFHFGVRWPVEPAPTLAVSTAPLSGPRDVHREADRIVLAEFAPPGVVVTDDLAIVQFRGRTGPFLEPTPGVASFDLLRMVDEELRLPLRRSIDEARRERRTVKMKGLRLSARAGSEGRPQAADEGARKIGIEVIPFAVASAAQRFYLVLFQEDAPQKKNAPTAAGAESSATGAADSTKNPLRQELASTRDYLQSVIEQLEASNEELKAANEEIVSSNEELLSTNEKLQMAKEELVAANEELRTVNEEMLVRNVEATRLGDDLTNVLSSVEIPILMLGRDSRLRRFTPAAAQLFRLVATDVGRPLADLRPLLDAPHFSQLQSEVLEQLIAVSREVQDERERWYELAVRPYLTADNRIDGTVISVVDIDESKKRELLLQRAAKYAEGIVDTVREALLVLDHELRVVSSNQSFRSTFGVSEPEIAGRDLDQLAQGAWDIPELLQRLAALREGELLEGLRVQREFKSAGPRIFLLNARRIEHTSLILLALEDVTADEKAQRALDAEAKHHVEQELIRRVAFNAALAEERERRRIAADLHDRIGQALALAQIKLVGARELVSGEARTAFNDTVELLAESVAQTRSLTFDLSPPVLYDLGLAHALSWLAEDVEKRMGLQVELQGDVSEKPLNDAAAALVFRGVRELLLNVFKHAGTSQATVRVGRLDDQLEITVEDQGEGFDAEGEMGSRSAHASFGLLSLRERITRLGGTLYVESKPRQGTRVRLRVPLDLEKPGGTRGTEILR